MHGMIHTVFQQVPTGSTGFHRVLFQVRFDLVVLGCRLWVPVRFLKGDSNLETPPVAEFAARTSPRNEVNPFG